METKISNYRNCFVFAYLLVAIFLVGCEGTQNTQKIENGISFVGRYEVVESKMKYIVYREADGGLFIINTTKDSIETAFYLQQLDDPK